MDQPNFTTKLVKKADAYAEFVIEPLEQGYGSTLGNALRRVLLTSLPGAAITEVKIAGVKHQFSTLQGLKEDIVELILNLKQVRLSYTGSTPVTLSLDIKGQKTVTARDIKVPATVTIVNPDQPLVTLTDKDAKLSAQMTVTTGVGYSPAEERKSDTVGVIPVDATFSPVTRVAYSIESTRVGRRTDYDKLLLNLWTNGTIKPKAALDLAAQILVGYFKQLYSPVKVKAQAESASPVALTGEIYDLTVEELDLPTRIANALRKGGFKTVAHLVSADPKALATVKNLGEKSVVKVRSALKKKGLDLKQ